MSDPETPEGPASPAVEEAPDAAPSTTEPTGPGAAEAPATAAPPQDLSARPARRRDYWITSVCGALLLALMRVPGHQRFGVLVGLALTLGLALGVMGLLGDSPLDLRGDEARAPENAPAWWRTGGGLVVLFGVALYVPFAGFGLWDPWETHYSEVAREILSRDDWITLWWAQEGWFMSKPILVFWMSALGMGAGSAFGLQVGADAGPSFQEWCIRLPIIAATLAALYALYRAVAQSWGARAGVLAALVLATMPQWFFLAHQAMTDMPFVAPLVIAVSMFILAVTVDPAQLSTARAVRVGGVTLRVSLWHLTVGAVLVLALPQIAYLLTRSMVTSCPADANLAQCRRMLALNRVGSIQVPVEMFWSGSAGNSAATLASSVQGSPVWERVASHTRFFPSVLQGVVWLAVLHQALEGLRRERSLRGLYFVLFYVGCAVSTMGKGPAGLAIPGAVAALHFAATRRWRELTEIRLGLGVLVFLVVGMPWYVAIYGRLGDDFIQRFVVHDIINRTVLGVHGDTGSVRYFLWQLGYAMFPWTGLVPVALMGALRLLPADATRAQRDVARVGVLWFLMAFVLFSAMATKFHHYIFPAIPGAALVVGLLLHSILPPETELRIDRRDVARLAAQALGAALVAMGAARCVGHLSGRVRPGAQHVGAPALGAAMLALGLAALLASLRGARDERPADDAARLRAANLGAIGLSAAALVGIVGRDLATSRSVPPGSERLIHLFVYNYDRAWPVSYLNHQPMLLGWGVVAALMLACLAAPRAKAWAARGITVVAALFAAWSLDVYMIDVTPHWSQRPLFERYYAERRPSTADPRFPFDPIVAHQMNWKGENFYTGNRVVAEECGLKYCTGSTSQFMREHPNQRMFFITEHSRVRGLLSSIRAQGGEGRELTTEAENNKFVLVLADLGASAPGRR
ncbi:MAG: glycosyltransferase family 39 protein [Polyangiales bacterium]